MVQKPPPKDQDGLTIPHDCPEIQNEHRLIRRISEEWIVSDHKGKKRLSTAALDPSSEDYDKYCGLSVDIEHFILNAGLDPKKFVTTPKFTGAISFSVDSFRSRSFLVGTDPSKDNPYHGAVWQNETQGAKFTRGKKKELLKEAEWLVPLDDVDII